MARDARDRQTLGELLDAAFFLENDKPFLVIYDKYDVLLDYFNNAQQKQLTGDFNILSIIATRSPAEFIDRQAIVDDFDDNAGWYRHRWIVHVHGENAGEVGKARSFYYYQMFSKSIVLEGFIDLLMNPVIDLVKSKATTSVLDKYPQLNRYAVKYLTELPVPSIVSDSGTFHEPLAWLLLFTSDNTINPFQATRSPAWASLASTRAPCTHATVLLDLIYHVHPLNVPMLDESTRSTLFGYFSTFLADLGIEGFPLPEDWFDTFTRIIRFGFQHGKPPVQAKPASKKKPSSSNLDPFFAVKSQATPTTPATPAPKPLLESTTQLFRDWITDWITNADETLASCFQQWTFLLRKQQSSPAATSPAITEETLQETINSFSLTGMIDINIAAYLLGQQEREPIDAKPWCAKVDEIIKKRKALWDKATRVWWSQRKLFFTVSKDHDKSMKDFWHFVRQLGQFFSYRIPEKKQWKDIADDAWDIESLHVAINDPVFHYIFDGAEYCTIFAQLIGKLNARYHEFNRHLNVAFSSHYSHVLQENGKSIYSDFDKNVWKVALAAVSRETPVGFVFCDAMRKDLALDLIAALERKMKENKDEIVESVTGIQRISTVSILPSITDLGWNSALNFGDKLQVKLSGDNLVSGIINDTRDGSAMKLLGGPEAREARIGEIFLRAGKRVVIHHVDHSNFNADIDVLHQKREKEQDAVIPIVWYNKFDTHKVDNHDFTLTDFIQQKPAHLAELRDIILKLHEVGIRDIFVIADHGFLFTSNDKILTTKPDSIGKLHKRHCISHHVFTGDDMKDYPDWHIFPVNQLPFTVDASSPDIKTLIFPRGDTLFKKSAIDDPFYIHGGLSFQECDLLHFSSHCEFKPSVEIESIEPVDHGEPLIVKGKETYYLRETQGATSRYLQIQVQTKKKGDRDEKLRAITIKVVTEDPRILVDPAQETTLPSGAKRNYILSFDKTTPIMTIAVCIKNPDNEIIKKKEFYVLPPSPYGTDSFI
nr:hypothetical protein [Candidatus Sigynarchaeota archaeon]